MNWTKIALSLALTSVVLVHSEHADVPASPDEPAAKADSSDGARPKTAYEALAAARAEYAKNGGFSGATETGLLLLRKQIVPLVRRQLQNPGAPDTLPFWLALVREYRDDSLYSALFGWLKPGHWAALEDYAVREAYARTVRSGLGNDPAGALQPDMDEADPATARLILDVLTSAGALTGDVLSRWETRYAKQPQMISLIDYYGSPQSDKKLMELYDRLDLSGEAKYAIVSRLLALPKLPADERQWLAALAARNAAAGQDTQIEQTIDMRLVLLHGDGQAADRLLQSGERDGYRIVLDSRVERLLAERHPDSALAQGIKRYEAFRGTPYFQGEDSWYDAAGSDYAHPQDAVAEWLAFLRDYPKHPAADDAAFRLARCYEMLGRYAQALHWFEQARTGGDGDMGYDASGMFTFVLDADMTTADYAKLDKSQLPDWAAPWIDYSAAVSLLRDDRYAEAAEALRRLTAAYGDKDILTVPPAASPSLYAVYAVESYPFWEKVKEQLALADQLAGLQRAVNQADAADRPQRLYQMAAFIYHHPMLYYNYLWRDGRTGFFTFGHLNDGDDNPVLSRYTEHFNNYAQAIKLFGEIDLSRAGPELGAKTLYSLAMSESKLIDYGSEVRYYDSDADLARKLTSYARRLVDAYPDSDLADDALLLMYDYSQDPSLLLRIIDDYPDGDQAKTAREWLAHPPAIPSIEPANR